MSKVKKYLAVMAAFAVVLSTNAVSTGSARPQGATTLFEMEDPEDDDHGLDTYMYPENLIFVPGAFDLLYFAIKEEGTDILFELTFRTLGENPWAAPNGFSLQLVEIYVNDGTGKRKTPIPVALGDRTDNARVTIENGWRWAVRATGWPRGHGGEYNTHGRWEDDRQFDVRASASANTISVRVPKDVVGSPTAAQPWWCTVLVGSSDEGRWRKVVPVERSLVYVRWMPAAEDLPVAGLAYAKKVEPRPMDILVPAWTSQKEVLSAFRVEPEPAFAKVYAVGPVPAPPYFSISLSPRSGIVRRGDSVQTTVHVKRFLGYDRQVTLSALGVPSGVTATFSPATGTPPFNSTLTLTTGDAASVGSFLITIVASGADGRVERMNYKLSVASELFEMSDPVGDDDGPGTYKYPTNPVFAGKPGLFDITRFVFYSDGENLYFVITFAADRLGGNVWSGELGFSFQVVEIYVDCKPGGSTVPLYAKGPRVRIDKDHPWDFAVQATGWYRPHKAVRNWLAIAGRPEPLTRKTTVESDLAARTISVTVPRRVIVSELGQVWEESAWHAVVIAGSQDGFSEHGSWRFVYVDNRDMWQGSGADALAFAMGVSPNVYDLVVPPGYDQRQVLRAYNPDREPPEGYAEVPAFRLAVAQPPGRPPELPLPLIGGIVAAIAVIAAVAVFIRRRSR